MCAVARSMASREAAMSPAVAVELKESLVTLRKKNREQARKARLRLAFAGVPRRNGIHQ